MTVRKTRAWLRAVSITLIACALVVAVSAWFAPPDLRALHQPSAASSATDSSRRNASNVVLPSIQAFESVWALDLRRPLHDGVSPTKSARAPLAVKLTGTIIESQGKSQAIFLVPAPGSSGTPGTSGAMQVELHTVGERVGGAQILEIAGEAVTLLYEGERVTLRVEGGTP